MQRFLLPGSSYLEPAPCFRPSFYLCQFFQIFLKKLSLLRNLLFSPIALIVIRLPLSLSLSVCARFVLYALTFENRAFKECKRELGALSIITINVLRVGKETVPPKDTRLFLIQLSQIKI